MNNWKENVFAALLFLMMLIGTSGLGALVFLLWMEVLKEIR